MATRRLGPVHGRPAAWSFWAMVLLGLTSGRDATAGPVAGADLKRGQKLFERQWFPHDPRSRGGDGLGPVYNESSCRACHVQAAPGGAGSDEKNVLLASTTVTDENRREREAIHPGFHDASSIVLHRYGADPRYDAWRARFLSTAIGHAIMDPAEEFRSSVILRDVPVPGSVTKFVQRRWSHALNMSFVAGIRLAERNTPPLFGVGLIDKIPDQVLIDAAGRRSSKFPGVRGRVSRTADGRIGRFGWKAQVPTLGDFVVAACANELGLEVPGKHQTAPPNDPRRAPKGLDLDDSDLAALTAFVSHLPAPIVDSPADSRTREGIAAGRDAFDAVGCATCHSPALGPVEGIYSDLLLHDMGDDLRDGASYYGTPEDQSPGLATPAEWRTPPLWGLRDSGPYLHDGSVDTIEAAVALHGGEAESSTRRYFELKPEKKHQLEMFLMSLAAPALDDVLVERHSVIFG
ncbi:MAG TPA: di-heme oxidoredictase family protein [Isosphaeraceae bacterium]|nr:di-heme oxidoredictase family protein [Isosphaeraceae bacterium]